MDEEIRGADGQLEDRRIGDRSAGIVEGDGDVFRLGHRGDFFRLEHPAGMEDVRLDLLCFRMAEELMFLRKNRVPIDTMAQKIHSIASYLQLNFLELIDFDELAGKHGLSRCTFYRQWSRYFQQTPAQFLLNLRLEWAKEQLAYSRIKIYDLTRELHFSTVAYFCAIFKKQFGMTPLQYKKNQDGNQKQ